MQLTWTTARGVFLATAVTFGAAKADEFTDTIEAAMEAYEAGDIKTAKEEIDFAAQLLGQMKAEGLSAFLPEALDGWEREVGDTQSMAALGGGQMASATYTKDGQTVEIQLMAGNQMVTAMGAMFSNPALMGAAGKVKRINRQKVVITKQGEIQTLINQVLVQISGSADVDAKEEYFGEMDVKGLDDF